MERLTKVFQIL